MKIILSKLVSVMIVLSLTDISIAQIKPLDNLPVLPPMPEIPEAKEINSVPMGNSRSFEEVKLGIPITDGPFQPTWKSIEENYPGTPQWLRDAKFGIWVDRKSVV